MWIQWPLFQKLERSLTPIWPLTQSLLRSHLWLYPRIIVFKAHENISKYIDTVTLFSKTWTKGHWPLDDLWLHIWWGHMCDSTIDIHLRSQNLHHLDSGMGLKLGSSDFSRNQNYRGSSGAHVTCIYCGLSVKINTCKCRTAFKDRGNICIAYVFGVCGRQNPKTPHLSPMADDAITRGGIGGLGSPVYIYGLYPRIIVSKSHEKYINVCGYSEQFCKIPHTTYIHTYILRTEWLIT